MSASQSSLSAPSSPSGAALLSRPGVLLGVLTALNLLNYLDRYILAPVIPDIRRDLHITAAQAGLLVSAFFFSYMVLAPLVGIVAKPGRRNRLVAAGIAVWSVATLLSGIAHTYGFLLFTRALVGVGEASYSAIAPALISDLYPEERRSRMLAIFYTAIIVGDAAGLVLGGQIDQLWGWHKVFLVAGLPGLLLAMAMFIIPEPQAGACDPPWLRQTGSGNIKSLFSNRPFVSVTAGTALSTFTLGALAFWMPSFLEKQRHLTPAHANTWFGLMTLFNGIVATIAGGWLGDWLNQRRRGGLFLVSSWSMLLGLPIAAVAIFAHQPRVFLPAMFFAEFALFLNGGPMNAAMVNAVPAPIRAAAAGVNMLLIHLCGDLVSPPLVGWVADKEHNLTLGVAVILPALLLGGIVLWWQAAKLETPTEAPTSAEA